MVGVTPSEFWALLWGQDTDLHEVRLPGTTCWIPCPDQRALLRLLDAPGAQISLAPRAQRDPLTWHRAHLIWCHLRTGEAEENLMRFRPAPTAVIRAGETHDRWALWALSRPLQGNWIQRANDRVNHRLRGLRRDGNPEALMPSPFTSPMFVEHYWPQLLTPRQIVGNLREAPDPNGWKARRDAASAATESAPSLVR